MATKNHLLNPKLFSPDVDRISTRDGFGKGLVRAGELEPRVVALAADLMESTRLHWFAQTFPDRFFQVGVAEQNMVTVASGMAAAGKLPVVASYATFSPGRNWEQIRTTICYNDQPVIIVGSHAGLSVGPDGATHQALEDVALMRVLPNMSVIVPCDAKEAYKAIVAATGLGTPVYLRVSRADSPIITQDSTPFTFGKIQKLPPSTWQSSQGGQTGSDVTIVASGPVLYEALLAARELAKQDISVEVLNCVTIKPFDTDTLLASAKKTGLVVTVEEHQIAGGLGGIVAETLATSLPTPQEFVGIRDLFGESGKPEELWKKFGLLSADIVSAVERGFKRKSRSTKKRSRR